MTSEELREEFIGVLKKEFPLIRVKDTTLKSGNIRISPYVPNNKKNKRWMQIDANPEYLSIAMDHSFNDIKLEDINNLNLLCGLNGSHSAIQLQKNNDAVNISIFTTEPYDFSNNEFVDFLHKHYQSYLKLIN
ncbi:hypothetical protein LAV72_16020 [Lysinibacillus xylanilyticus]|uniref:hypothetical protein n=1 Tax=Lysinibacillus xylanilyticus TaxID=582475 RepID=UPI002B24F7A7|nr:hypothetical protein [Lysinibacillus xylanilyticus]MEB2301127.1 hypothetical protein [Lysinibacillus xylanilyticus]